LALALSFAATTPAAAHDLRDSRIGNGGYGVMVDGRLHSLDLAIRNVHLDPYMSAGVGSQLPEELHDIVDYHLGRILLPSVLEIVEHKLVELGQRAAELHLPYSVEGLVRNMDRYRWLELSDLECTDVGDDQSPFPNKVQLAYRKDMWVRFCRDAASLPEPDMAALALHEIVYALHTEATTYVPQLVGYLFSHEFATFGTQAQNELRAIVQGLTGSGSGEPATIYNRLKSLFDGGMLPSASEFYVDQAWSGKCVRLEEPDTQHSMLISSFRNDDPVLGPMISLVPMISPTADMRYVDPTPANLARYLTDAGNMVREQQFTSLREPDFSFTGSYNDSRNYAPSTSCSGEQTFTFKVRRNITSQGEPLYLLSGVSTYSYCGKWMCYANKPLAMPQ
jgi:hypothetical protein